MDKYLLIAVATIENPNQVDSDQLKMNAAYALRDQAADAYFSAGDGEGKAELAAIAAATAAAAGDRDAAEYFVAEYFVHNTAESSQDYLNQVNNNVFTLV